MAKRNAHDEKKNNHSPKKNQENEYRFLSLRCYMIDVYFGFTLFFSSPFMSCFSLFGLARLGQKTNLLCCTVLDTLLTFMCVYLILLFEMAVSDGSWATTFSELNDS